MQRWMLRASTSFTGHVSLRKAGAAGTVLRRRKKTEYLEAKSVPVGILPEIAFARSEKDLDAGDMLVMVSDGVTASGTEWLCDLIANYEDDDPQALSERIVERAVKRPHRRTRGRRKRRGAPDRMTYNSKVLPEICVRLPLNSLIKYGILIQVYEI